MKMKRILWFLLVSALIACVGCESQEQPSTQSAPPVSKPEKEAKAEQVPTVVETAKEVAEQAVQQVGETAKAVESTVAEEAKEVATMAEEGKSAAAETVAKVEDKIETTAAAATDSVKQMASEATKPVVPQEVVLKASYGDVTMPHSMHADTYDCSTCHGDGTPAAFDLGKDKAHTLCKGCHKEVGAGPTGCTGCHKK